jgi:HD-GYP domain-containing protein (c-di-GMP phosphodiesterase class II)
MEKPYYCQRHQQPCADDTIKTIFKYIGKIAALNNVDDMILVLADMGRDLIVADRCTVWLHNKDDKTLWTKAAHGIDRIVVPDNAGIVGSTFCSQETILINDAYNDDRFDSSVDLKTGYVTKNIIAIPMFNVDHECIGVYQAINKMTDAGEFSAVDKRYLMLAATYTGSELGAFLYRQEIENTQKEIIFTMAEAGESRSKETGNHVRRVAEYSYILAKGYGLDESDCELLKMASPMHDIGKIAIPDSILLKPGKLDDDEFKKMKTHSYKGYKMLKHSDRKILKAAGIVAYEHHEKWNGKGYPRGLQGEDIHVFGRITAIADVFDALGSDRVYKKSWDFDKILNLFKEERGEHFDPKLVDVFMDNLDKILEIREKYKDI